jgi:hypothetical protein
MTVAGRGRIRRKGGRKRTAVGPSSGSFRRSAEEPSPRLLGTAKTATICLEEF